MIRPFGALITFTFSGVATGHHAFTAFYDLGDIGDVRGEVIEAHWINPHTELVLRSEDGEIWTVDTAPVNRLQRLGLERVVGPGDQVTVSGALSRLGRNAILATNMTLPTGTEVLLDPDLARRIGIADRVPEVVDVASEPAVEPEGIYRVWSRYRTENDRGPERSFTPDAEASRAEWDAVTDDPALQCIAPGMPVAMDTPFPMAFEEGDGRIILRIEQWDAVRNIHMGESFNPLAQPESLLGYSRGHWENNSLVVETTHIDWPYIDEFGSPQSDAFKLTERFTFTEDFRGMTWEATAEDPATFTEPAYLGRSGYRWIPGVEIKGYDCTIITESN